MIARFLPLLFASAVSLQAQDCGVDEVVPATLDASFRGQCVAVDGGRILFGTNLGEASLFSPDGLGGWVEQPIVPADTLNGDPVGVWSCDLEGDRLVIGGRFGNGIYLGTGAVYVFDWDGSAWVETKLMAPDGTGSDWFGHAVDLEGDRLMIGSPGDNPSGSVYFYVNDGADWVLEDRVPMPAAVDESLFGWSVALEGDRAVAGAPLSSADLQWAGQAWVLENNGAGDWEPLQLFAANPPLEKQTFGAGVALEGDRIVIGASYMEASGTLDPGSVYVLEWDGSTYVESATLQASAAPVSNEFGGSLRLRGDELLVGAPGTKTEIYPTGAAFLFRYNAGAWEEVEVVYSDALIGSAFGEDVDFEGGLHAYAQARNSAAGHLWIHEPPLDSFSYGYCSDAQAPCGNGYSFAGCANSTGLGGRLRACGGGSIASDGLTLRADHLPANQFGLIFMGTAAPATPLGDGLRVVGGDIYRFPVQATGSGSFTLGPGLAAQSVALFPQAGHVVAGSSWAFQAWHRDSGGPCSGSSNLTNGVLVRFVP